MDERFVTQVTSEFMSAVNLNFELCFYSFHFKLFVNSDFFTRIKKNNT